MAWEVEFVKISGYGVRIEFSLKNANPHIRKSCSAIMKAELLRRPNRYFLALECSVHSATSRLPCH